MQEENTKHDKPCECDSMHALRTPSKNSAAKKKIKQKGIHGVNPLVSQAQATVM